MTAHPSDDLCNWMTSAEQQAAAIAAWDKIVAAGLEAELRALLDLQKATVGQDIAYDNEDFSF